jgi:hypothetical protein
MVERIETEAIERMLEDLSRADLGDPRRVARAKQVLARLAAQPNASLPDALVTDAELEGAYRLFSNDHVSFEQLFDVHAAGTADRARDAKLVLALHDTTTCMFRHADPKEVGYLNTGKAGFPLHMALLVDTHNWGRPFGLTHAEVLPRDKRPRKRGSKHRVSGWKTARQSDKEFTRWRRGIDITEARLGAFDGDIIHIADRESDSYELMAMCLRDGHRFIFRARNNRNVVHDGSTSSIRTLVASADVLLERKVPLSRRIGDSAPRSRKAHPPRDARVAKLCFASAKATFRRPKIASSDLPATIEVNVLHVFESEAPAAEAPVDWLLYTTEPLDTCSQIEAVVDYYRCRWQIEELNKALKTGCVVQERQLESLDALTTMLALSLPIAVELLALRALARADESSPAELALSKPQLAALRHMSHRELPAAPTIKDVLWCIAGLGGHIKNNGPAGWQILQRGMEKFIPFASGWCAREATETSDQS